MSVHAGAWPVCSVLWVRTMFVLCCVFLLLLHEGLNVTYVNILDNKYMLFPVAAAVPGVKQSFSRNQTKHRVDFRINV